MRRSLSTAALLLFLALLSLLGTSSFRADSKLPAPAGKAPRTVRPFTLPAADGKAHALKDIAAGKKAVVVLFIGTECPINNAYMPRLGELHKEHAARGVAFVGINPNCHDTPVRIAAHAREHKLPFPVLKDAGNVVADAFGARRTPEAFVLAPDGKVLYHGRIDDQFGLGYQRKAPTRRDLNIALDEVLAGKPVSQPATPVAGCLIARAIKPAARGTYTYTKHVSRILQKNCQECHRPGQIGPMSLLTYDDAVSWADMISEVVSARRMPPWYADPKHGKFSNDRSLSKEDRTALLTWIKEGCPRGEAKDEPKAKAFAAGWRIGKPDAVFTMPDEVTVPAEAGPRGLAYQYIVVPTNYAEDRWVVAAEAKPGARAVVHHIIVYVAERKKGLKKKRNRPDGIGDGFLVAYAPGDMPLMLGPGQAKKLPKGAFLVFQMHYTPNGVEQDDRSSVGLIFAKAPPKVEVRTRSIAQRRLEIPAGAPNHEVKSVTTFERDVDLLSMLPHMHLRGKDFKYEVEYPDGRKEVLLSVPRYDFNWQSNYRLARPLRLPAGTKIHCTAHFDNSAGNPNNPDPKSTVRWGDQTWQEMMIGFIDYAYTAPRAAPPGGLPR
jgi:peroxiredoxin